ncbi:hypothetical protein [Catenulispora rubra]|uniref:hypothetical protein n=1 Tax=Catenulispora rubra TaxID=280293 RepID=UPI0018920BE0|nr:hypothetical protein [Catenulispora rubra]
MTSTISTTATTRTVAEAAAEPVRLHVDHTAVKRLGNWTSAERFEVHARRGSVVLDLRSPQLPAGELVVDLDLDRAVVKLLLPDDAVVDQRDIVWNGSGKVKDAVGQHNERNGVIPAEGVRRIRLTGRIHSGEVRVARGGVAMLAAMFSREYVEDVKQARREGAWPTVDDPTRAPKAA